MNHRGTETPRRKAHGAIAFRTAKRFHNKAQGRERSERTLGTAGVEDMRKWIIIALLAIPALVISGFFLRPATQSEQCFERIKIGMTSKEAGRILTEHEFKLCPQFCGGYSFVNSTEDSRIEIRLGSGRVIDKQLDSKDGVCQRTWKSVREWICPDDLPGPFYIRNPPTYFPSSLPYPLPSELKELDSIEVQYSDQP